MHTNDVISTSILKKKKIVFKKMFGRRLKHYYDEILIKYTFKYFLIIKQF